MSSAYSELVISGPFALVKGFLLGYRSGSGIDFGYFFHRKAGIRRDTLAELVKEALDLDNFVHLCLERTAVEGFKKAVKNGGGTVGIQVTKERKIKAARFDFSFNVNNRELADEVKKDLDHLPEGVHLEDYEPEERREKSREEETTAGYAPLHKYTFRGHGTVAGDFDGVMKLYVKTRRGPDREAILAGDISLDFED